MAGGLQYGAVPLSSLGWSLCFSQSSVLLAADLIVALADVAFLVSLHFVRETGEKGD